MDVTIPVDDQNADTSHNQHLPRHRSGTQVIVFAPDIRANARFNTTGKLF
ncbi:hypothetical protein LPB41_19470 [Thalassospira sp. MA62]|nr:hypothetical protein [Thalassospira sp. MA62]